MNRQLLREAIPPDNLPQSLHDGTTRSLEATLTLPNFEDTAND